MNAKPVAAGKSSMDHIDEDKTFALFPLFDGIVFCDLACGIGRYSVEFAKRMTGPGQIYSVDLWEEGIAALKETIAAGGVANVVTPVLADITTKLPLDDGMVDSCLFATVLHDLQEQQRSQAIGEAARIVKTGGVLSVIEFKLLDHGPGPKREMRLSAEDLDALLEPFGFQRTLKEDIGEFVYLVQYKKQ